MHTLPSLVFTFANDTKAPLDNLSEEKRAIQDALRIGTGKAHYQIVTEETLDVQTFKNIFYNYGESMQLFHFGGHANAHALHVWGGMLSVENIAEFAAVAPRLHLVFLNGCLSLTQAKTLIDVGVPAVIAVSTKIDTKIAQRFAEAFYLALAVTQTTLEEAFLSAKALTIRYYEGLNSGFSIHSKPRFAGWDEEELNRDFIENFPFQLCTQEEDKESILGWKLPIAAAGDSVPPQGIGITDLNFVKKDDIVGRGELIDRIYLQLQKHQKACLLSGMGGIGKTMVAQGYMSEYKDRYSHIAWIHYQDSLAKSFFFNPRLRKFLDIIIPERATPEEVFPIIQAKLAKMAYAAPNLLILDNADPTLTKEDIEKLPIPPHWHVLLTAREKISDTLHPIRIGFLEEGDALVLWKKHCQRLTDKEAQSLIQMIDRHTLTLEILAKAAHEYRYSYEELSQAVRRNTETEVEIRHDKGSELKQVKTYLHRIIDLLKLTDREQYILRLLALLPADAIPAETLATLLGRETFVWKEAFYKTLDSLAAKSLLTYYSATDSYKLHIILSAVIRDTYPPDPDTAQPLIEGMTQLLSIDQATYNPTHKFPYVPWADALLVYFPSQTTPTFNAFYNNLALVYKELGRYSEAAALLEKALASDIQHFGEAHPTVARDQSNLGLIYGDLGRYAEAAALLEKSLASDIQHFGEAHPTVAVRLSNLGLIYQGLGRYSKAAALLEKALASDIQHFGEAHPTVAVLQSNLGNIYKNLGRYLEAAVLMEKALASNIQHFGEAHPTVATLQSNLGNIYQDLGRYPEAAALLEKALASSIQHFGEAHPTVATRQSNLGSIYKDLGRYSEAAELMEQSIVSVIQHFGEAHPNVAILQSNLGLIYQDLGRYAEAAALLEKALASAIQHFGEAHPTVATRQSNLGNIYKNLGRYPEAAALLEKALASDIQHFGEVHPMVAIRQSNLGLIYQDLGLYPEATALFQKSLASDIEHFGEAHPTVAIRNWNLGVLYLYIQKQEEGIALMLKAYSFWHQHLGEDHPNTVMARGIFQQLGMEL